MSVFGIFSSPTQRRAFLFASGLIILIFSALAGAVYHFSPDTRGWNLILDMLVALLSSAVFVILATIYLKHFFRDPFEISHANKLLPQDIHQALSGMAESALEYRLFVRTGRHFRSEVLPILTKRAITLGMPIGIDVILLDFRNDSACDRYASYRRSASFDRHLWSKEYVQIEILATILKLLQAVHDHSTLIRVNLYLSSRLSTFRFDGSHDQIIVTREDPRDVASHYQHSDNEFSAYRNEFNWTREDAGKVDLSIKKGAPIANLRAIFNGYPIVLKSENAIIDATTSPSPYVR